MRIGALLFAVNVCDPVVLSPSLINANVRLVARSGRAPLSAHCLHCLPFAFALNHGAPLVVELASLATPSSTFAR